MKQNVANHRHPLFKYALLDLWRKKKKYFVIAIPIFISLGLFTFLYAHFHYYMIVEPVVDKILEIDKKTITLDIDSLNKASKEEYVSRQNPSEDLCYFDNRLAFSNKDVAKVKNLDGVEKVTTFQPNILQESDFEGDYPMAIDIPKENLPEEVKESLGYAKNTGGLVIDFLQSNIPFSFSKNYNPNYVRLATGRFPKDNSLEILIPDIYAWTMDKNFANVIGKKVRLQIKSSEAETESEKEYSVSGVYGTHYESFIESNTIFLGHDSEFSFTNDLDEEYKIAKTTVDSFPKSTKVLYAEMFQSKETFKKAWGTGEKGLVIVCRSEKDAKNVSQDLKKIFPHYQINSYAEFQDGELHEENQKTKWTFIGVSALIAVLLGGIIGLINRLQIKIRNKELSILYSAGYRQIEIFLIIISENTVLFAGCLLLSYMFLGISLAVMPLFQMDTSGVVRVFQPANIIYMLLVTFIIMQISTLWGILGIRKGKILHYLSELQ